MVKRLLTRLTVLALVASASIAFFGGTSHADKPDGDALCAGNTIYVVCVDDIANKGRYTAKTGPLHPVPGVNLLFGGAGNSPATSHSSYRSFTTGTTYTQGTFGTSFNLSPFASVTLLGTTGVRTTYTLPGPPATPDELLIVQDVNVNGSTLANSNVAITTTITNHGGSPVAMGVRYLWDFQIGVDDGPTFQAQSPDGMVLHYETEFTPPNFSFYRIVDNDTNPTPPTYQVFGTANGPTTLIPQPTPPTQLTYGCWPSSFTTSFDYSIGSPPRDVADQINDCTGGLLGGDSDVIYWWGRSAATALELGPAESTTTNALLFAAAPNAPPPIPGPPAKLTLEPKMDTNQVGQPHCVTATVTDSSGTPLPGVTVRFSVSGANSASGAATTDANGQATFCYTGTVAGTDTIFAFADTNNNGMRDQDEPSDTATKVYKPGQPATLTLSPKTAINTVDSRHCVTATVKDAFGNPTPGITVRFTVTGSVNTSSSVSTDANGQATFCYTGSLPGADVITAYADTNNNNVQDPGEPGDRAQKTWVTSVSTEGCKVTYGGRIIATNMDKATFGGNAQAPDKGQEEYQDHGPAQPRNVHSINVTSVTCSADKTQASIFGQATINGAGSFNYRIDMKDLDEPGRTDTYRIRLSDGYDSGEKTLEGGNVQIHK